MPLYEWDARMPRIGEGSFIHESADIIGDVRIGKNCYIGLGVRIKGDYNTVEIGDRTIIQDNCILHGNAGETLFIGSDVIIGHGCILHSCIIKNGALIGMGSIVSDWAVIGENSIVGEGCVVPQRKKIPERKIAVGVPARIVGDVSDSRLQAMISFRKKYVDIYKRYGTIIRRI
jgi:phenylacetic acid degradation protein